MVASCNLWKHPRNERKNLTFTSFEYRLKYTHGKLVLHINITRERVVDYVI